MPSERVMKLFQELTGMSRDEANLLAKKLFSDWNIPEPQDVFTPVQVVEEIVEEQTEFSVYLTKSGPERIKVIKGIRALLNLPLKEAKDFVDGVERGKVLVLADMEKTRAESVADELKGYGAEVEIS